MAEPSSSDLFLSNTKEIGLGLSTLRSLATGEMSLEKIERLAVPDNMVRLAELVLRGSEEHQRFLERLIADFQPSIMGGDDRENLSDLASHLASTIVNLNKQGRITQLGQIDELVLASFGDSFGGYVISLSPPSNFVRDYLAKLYSWSLKNKGIVLERGRRILSRISHQITTIQFPDRLASFFRVKDQFSDQVFSYVGGRAAKYFVCIAVAGLGLAFVPASAAGLVIAVIDP